MSKTLHLPTSARTRGVALPRSAESEILREQDQLSHELYAIADKLDHFNRELYKIDPWLTVVIAKPNTTVLGLKPNYYHLIRQRPGHPAWIKPVEGPNGEWRDLDSSLFDLVAEADLWNDRTQREMRQKQNRAEAARQRQRDREAQDRVTEFNERLKSATSTSISVSKAVS